jgi:hypothetical protein
VESEEGRGATFRISLPGFRPEAVSPAQPRAGS